MISSPEVYPNIFDVHVTIAPSPFLDSDYFCEVRYMWKPRETNNSETYFVNLKHSALRYQGVKTMADGSVQQLTMVST